jgi:ABC-type multidrug transport system fused ATPase/permease subunit
LILDEPTSRLDATATVEVNATLRRLAIGKTVLRVAHRLEDLRGCDVILVLQEGRLAEKGSHAELIENGGWYQTICALQSLGAS